MSFRREVAVKGDPCLQGCEEAWLANQYNSRGGSPFGLDDGRGFGGIQPFHDSQRDSVCVTRHNGTSLSSDESAGTGRGAW